MARGCAGMARGLQVRGFLGVCALGAAGMGIAGCLCARRLGGCSVRVRTWGSCAHACLSTCARSAVQGGGHTGEGSVQVWGAHSGVRVLQHTVAAVGAGAVPPAWALTRGRVGASVPTAVACTAHSSSCSCTHMEKSSRKHWLAQPEVWLGKKGDSDRMN